MTSSSQVANTVLKGPMVRGNIPTVAEVTHGEVVKFASAACKTMGEAGVTVLLEGKHGARARGLSLSLFLSLSHTRARAHSHTFSLANAFLVGC